LRKFVLQKVEKVEGRGWALQNSKIFKVLGLIHWEKGGDYER